MLSRRHTLVANSLTPPVIATRRDDIEGSKGPLPYWPAAIASLLLGAASVIPYNMMLAKDSGSPLFISFATHFFVVLVNFRTVRSLLTSGPMLPMSAHAAFVVLGFAFNKLKSSAFRRGPVTFCMLILNLQMLVGILIQCFFFGKRYSPRQLFGCLLVTVGVGVASISSSQNGDGAAVVDAAGLLQGALEMIGACIALCLLSIYVQKAFAIHGEATEEQVFVMHLCGIPLFLVGGQMAEIAPRIEEWGFGGQYSLLLLLLVNMAISYAEMVYRTRFTARCPSLLLTQLVETLKRFLSLLATALMNSPPLPPLGFWLGSMLLAIGTLVYLTSSDVTMSRSSSGSSSNSGSNNGSSVPNTTKSVRKAVKKKNA